MRAVSVVVRRVPLASMLKGLLPHLPRKVKEEQAVRGLGVVRLVVSHDLLLGLAVSVDESTAVCTCTSVVEMDDVDGVEAWLTRGAVEAVATLAEAGSSDDVELIIDDGRTLEAREVGVLWGGRVVRVPLAQEPSDVYRVCAARMLVQAASSRLEAVGRVCLWPRHVALVARTADAVGEPLRACLGRHGLGQDMGVVVWGYGTDPSSDMAASSYLAASSGSSSSAQVPVLDEACYGGPLLAPLASVILEDLRRPERVSVESQFVADVDAFLVSETPRDGGASSGGPGSAASPDAASDGTAADGVEGGERA